MNHPTLGSPCLRGNLTEEVNHPTHGSPCLRGNLKEGVRVLTLLLYAGRGERIPLVMLSVSEASQTLRFAHPPSRHAER